MPAVNTRTSTINADLSPVFVASACSYMSTSAIITQRESQNLRSAPAPATPRPRHLTIISTCLRSTSSSGWSDFRWCSIVPRTATPVLYLARRRRSCVERVLDEHLLFCRSCSLRSEHRIAILGRECSSSLRSLGYLLDFRWCCRWWRIVMLGVLLHNSLHEVFET